MTENKIKLTKEELIKTLKIVNKIVDDGNHFDFIEIITNSGSIGSILSVECDIEFKEVKGKFRTVISGVETW